MAILQVTNSKYLLGHKNVLSMQSLRDEIKALLVNLPKAQIEIIDAVIFDSEGAVDYLVYVDSELFGNVRGRLSTSAWQ